MNQNTSILGKLLDSAFRHRIVVLSIFFCTMGLTSLYLVTAPRQYASTMQMVVREAREKPFVSADKATPETQPETSQELMESHADEEYAMLSGNDIMQRAVQYRAQMIPGAPNPAAGTRQMAREIKRISGKFTIVPVRKTPVIEVTYRDVTPETAQAVLQEVQRADIEKHIKVMRPSGATQVFADEKASFDRQLEQAERDLTDFQIKNGITSLEDEKSSLEKDRDATRSALLQEQSSLASEEAQLKTLQNALSRTPERIPTTVKETPNYYSIQQVTSVLVDLVNQRTKLLTRYQPGDKLVTEVDKQIEDTNGRLLQLQTSPVAEKDSDNNPVWMQSQQQLALTAAAVSASIAKTNTLSNQVATLNARLHQLQGIEVESDALESRVDQLRDTRRQYADKLTSERVEDALDRAKLGNIAIAMDPTISRRPVSPNVPLSLALSLVSSIVVTGLYLFTIESQRTTFFTPYELSTATGVRVLGAIPNSRNSQLPPSAHLAAEIAFLPPHDHHNSRREENGNRTRRS